jgi:hypothetical protein
MGTSDLREANAKAAAKLAELEAYWFTLRASQKATEPSEVTTALTDAIAQRVKAAVLADDERLRGAPESGIYSCGRQVAVVDCDEEIVHKDSVGPLSFFGMTFWAPGLPCLAGCAVDGVYPGAALPGAEDGHFR